MAGIYIHIPFCKQACHYCDFHFSTNTKLKTDLLEALKTEMRLRREETDGWELNTLYLGGGTPSILSEEELGDLLGTAFELYDFAEDSEVTLEANPDDINEAYLAGLVRHTRVNRLSLGIQSFEEKELNWMNRAHNSQEAREAIRLVQKYIPNLSVDLIYGTPGQEDESWIAAIDEVVGLGIPHISSYALTVEERTALHSFIEKGKSPSPDEEQASRQFYLLVDRLAEAGYDHYEISNFGKPGHYSRNNSAYWQGKPYLGIGPGAHSYDQKRRGWNVRSNPGYIKELKEERLPIEWEELSTQDKYNEYLMTRLRTQWGVDLAEVSVTFGQQYVGFLEQQATPFIEERLLYWDGDVLKATREGKFLVDGIASDLFLLNLKD